jgi:hypothetical protein
MIPLIKKASPFESAVVWLQAGLEPSLVLLQTGF